MSSLIEGCTTSNKEVITSEVLRSQPRYGKPWGNICVTNNYRYVPFVVIIMLMAYDRVWNKSTTTGDTCGAETANPSRAPEVTPGFTWDSCCSMFGFLCNVLYFMACPVSFGNCIVCLCELRFVITPFGIFRLVLHFASQGWCTIFINVKHDIWREKSIIISISDKENILLCD
jgi:hypothetical protein